MLRDINVRTPITQTDVYRELTTEPLRIAVGAAVLTESWAIDAKESR